MQPKGLVPNAWYGLCYDRSDDEGDCRSCSLQRLCSSLWHPHCTGVWIQVPTQAGRWRDWQ